MADQQSVSQLIVQAEYQEPSQQNISQLLVQTEYQEPSQQNISQIIVQVEYQDPPQPITGSVMRFSQLAGAGVPPAAIVNKYSAGGVTTALPSASNLGMLSISSGSLTAGVLTVAGSSPINITGRGEINGLIVQIGSNDGVSRTIRAVLTIDGAATPQFDATAAASTQQNNGMVLIGSVQSVNGTYPNYLIVPEKVIYNKSFLLQIATSDTSTGKVVVGVIHKPY